MAGPTEQTFAAGPVVTGRGNVIASPFQFLFTGEDALRVVIANSLPGVSVAVQGRFLDLSDTRPRPFSQVLTPTSDRLTNTFTLPIGVGFLLDLTCGASAGAPSIGQTYVMVQIVRGLGAASIVLGSILGGHVTAKQFIAYPGSPIESSLAGQGFTRQVSGTLPAPGNEILETVPTGARWELLGHVVDLTTDATAVQRSLGLQFLSGGIGTYFTQAVPTIGPSTLGVFGFGAGTQFSQDAPSSRWTAPLATPTVITAGRTWGTLTVNLQAADHFTFNGYVVREWLEVA